MDEPLTSVFHLGSRDPKPQQEFGGSFLNQPPEPTSSSHFSVNLVIKEKKSGKIKNLEPHAVPCLLLCAMSQGSVGGGDCWPASSLLVGAVHASLRRHPQKRMLGDSGIFHTSQGQSQER